VFLHFPTDLLHIESEVMRWSTHLLYLPLGCTQPPRWLMSNLQAASDDTSSLLNNSTTSNHKTENLDAR
jgi:hypothetical protein